MAQTQENHTSKAFARINDPTLPVNDKANLIEQNVTFLRARLTHTNKTFDRIEKAGITIGDQIKEAQSPDSEELLNQVTAMVKLLSSFDEGSKAKGLLAQHATLIPFVQFWALGELMKTDPTAPRSDEDNHTLRRAFSSTENHDPAILISHGLDTKIYKSTTFDFKSAITICDQSTPQSHHPYTVQWDEDKNAIVTIAPQEQKNRINDSYHQFYWTIGEYKPNLPGQ